MQTTSKYALHGFVEFASIESGFITPIFENEEGVLFMQFSKHLKTIDTFLEVPSYYVNILSYYENHDKLLKTPGEDCIYGFKWKDTVVYKEAEDLILFLRNNVLRNIGDDPVKEIIHAFISDYTAMFRHNSMGIIIKNSQFSLPTKEMVWGLILDYIKNSSFSNNLVWLSSIEPVRYEFHTLYMETKSSLIARLFELDYKLYFINRLKGKFGSHFNIEIRCIAERKKFQYVSNWYKEIESGQNQGNIAAGQWKMHTRVNPFQNFENFHLSDYNVDAVSIGESFSKNYSSFKEDILVVYGETGMGKSHLINAIGNELLGNIFNLQLFYLTALEYIEFLSESVYSNSVGNFYTFFFQFKFIIIDDAHLLDLELEDRSFFWSTIFELSGKGVKIILAYNNSYDKWGRTESLYQGFYNLGKIRTISIKKTKHEDRVKILQKTSSETKINIAKNILNEIASAHSDNIFELRRSLTRLLIESNLKTKKMSLGLAREILENYSVKEPDKVNLSLFENTVCKFLRIEHKDLHSWSNDPKIETANQMTWFLRDLMLNGASRQNRLNEFKQKLFISYSFAHFQSKMFSNESLRNSVCSIYKEIISHF